MGMPWQKHSQISMKHRKKILMSEGDRNLALQISAKRWRGGQYFVSLEQGMLTTLM